MHKYKVGDKVRIVSERTEGMNSEGKMDDYLGTVMTIKSSDGTNYSPYSMEEDQGNNKSIWAWGDDMIECLVTRPVEVHPDFKEWYGDICEHWVEQDTQKAYAIYVINQMGFGKGSGQGLVNSYGEAISYKPNNELWDDMQLNKEKYTRAILDDSWIVRASKEPLYFIKLPGFGDYSCIVNQNKKSKTLSVDDGVSTRLHQTKFTKEEIFAIDSSYWQFREDA